VILSHTEILSRRIAFANQIFFVASNLCTAKSAMPGAFSNGYMSANQVAKWDFYV